MAPFVVPLRENTAIAPALLTGASLTVSDVGGRMNCSISRETAGAVFAHWKAVAPFTSFAFNRATKRAATCADVAGAGVIGIGLTGTVLTGVGFTVGFGAEATLGVLTGATEVAGPAGRLTSGRRTPG
ncbi:hypothetical protein GCM10029976_061520 [Kribbella albertanoniae]